MSKLINQVIAQSEPTFPYDGPFEPPEPEPGPTPTPTPPVEESAQVQLTTSTASLQIGATTTADIQIETEEAEVDNYTLNITFDPDILEVVDDDTTQTGTQVEFLDSAATVQTNNASNANGTITISASISGTSQTINRRIARITFRAKATGTSIVSVNKAQSLVNNTQGEDILDATTSLNFTVTGQTQTTPPSQTPPTQQLPQSGVADSLPSLAGIGGGILMLYVGIKIAIDNRKQQGIDKQL